MLRLEALSYSYPGHGPALNEVNAGLADGLTIVAGPNAGGKTTLLRVLAGLAEPDRGRVVSGSGAVLSTVDLRRMSRMVMQDADPQILGARVGEDILLGKASSSLAAAEFENAALELTRTFGLDNLWNERVDSLSYGQKRKLCLVHALLAGPRLLLLDEPFAGLDYPAAKDLRRFLKNNREAGLAQVVCTHELDPVFDIADWVLVMKEGGVAAMGAPEEVAGILEACSVRRPGGGWD